MTLQEQAWASASPATVLAELQRLHTLNVDGDRLTVSPPPGPRLTFQIKRYKPKLLELMGAGQTVQERIREAQERLGWKAPPTEESAEREAIQSEPAVSAAMIDFNPDSWAPTATPEWPTPVIDRRVLEEYCQHPEAQAFRRKLDRTTVVQLLCPACGKNLKGPRREIFAGKRSAVPWWPAESPVVPDPDAELDELAEWWSGVEGRLVDGAVFSPGVAILDATKARASLNEQIALWRLGEPDMGLSAQLKAHRAYLARQEAA